jgi:hypothetical protein
MPDTAHIYVTAIGSLLAIALIVIASDITIATGVARDVIAAVGQHLVILNTIRTLDQLACSIRSAHGAKIHAA